MVVGAEYSTSTLYIVQSPLPMLSSVKGRGGERRVGDGGREALQARWLARRGEDGRESIGLFARPRRGPWDQRVDTAPERGHLRSGGVGEGLSGECASMLGVADRPMHAHCEAGAIPMHVHCRTGPSMT